MFIGRRFVEYATSRRIKLITSTPYYAQINGQVKAVNKKHVGRQSRNWHNTLGQVLWAYRNSPKDLTKNTPYKLVCRNDAILPVEVNLQSQVVKAK